MIRTRSFDTYDEYVYKQGGKARNAGRRAFILRHLEKNTASFAKTFRNAAPHLKPGSVLCLGARSGAESLGAVEAGFKGSVGIDLHPVGPTVVQGDWHNIPFPAGSFDNAYCNSLDHCLYLDKFAAEVQRVLVPDGRLYVMATNRARPVEEWKGGKGKGNEAMCWQASDELRDLIASHGFVVKHEWRAGKWGHYVFGVKR